MEQEIVLNNKLEKIFAEKQKAIGEFAKEVAEREWELMEFNLFIASSGKRRLNEASHSVTKLRKLENQGKIDLTEFEDMADDF
jgi:hypothetical protein